MDYFEKMTVETILDININVKELNRDVHRIISDLIKKEGVKIPLDDILGPSTLSNLEQLKKDDASFLRGFGVTPTLFTAVFFKESKVVVRCVIFKSDFRDILEVKEKIQELGVDLGKIADVLTSPSRLFLVISEDSRSVTLTHYFKEKD